MQGVAGSLVDQHIDSSHLASINDAVSSRDNVVINQADPGSWHARQNCPRVTFLGPDSTRRNVDPTLPAIADKILTRFTPPPRLRPPVPFHMCTMFREFNIQVIIREQYNLQIVAWLYEGNREQYITVYQPAIVIMQGLYGSNRRTISKNIYQTGLTNYN